VLKTYFDRPTTEAAIDREVRRLRSGGQLGLDRERPAALSI
jgi:hypothetical protein